MVIRLIDAGKVSTPEFLSGCVEPPMWHNSQLAVEIPHAKVIAHDVETCLRLCIVDADPIFACEFRTV